MSDDDDILVLHQTMKDFNRIFSEKELPKEIKCHQCGNLLDEPIDECCGCGEPICERCEESGCLECYPNWERNASAHARAGVKEEDFMDVEGWKQWKK